MKNKIGKFLI